MQYFLASQATIAYNVKNHFGFNDYLLLEPTSLLLTVHERMSELIVAAACRSDEQVKTLLFLIAGTSQYCRQDVSIGLRTSDD